MRGPSKRRWAVAAGALVVVLAGCSAAETSAGSESGGGADAASESAGSSASPAREPEESAAAATEGSQEEDCDWDAPRVSAPANAPNGKDGELAEVLVGAWQHTHTDEGSGFEKVANDHRYVFPTPERMLYCQHVPGATEYADNAANVTLNGARIELPGGKYAYTVTAWDEDTLVWDNPVGGGYVYLLQRR